MDASQNLANEIKEIDAAVQKQNPPELTPQQQMWIDYNALNGLLTDFTEPFVDKNGKAATMRKVPIVEFSQMIGVSRETLRQWRLSIPGFWEKVNKRRAELAPQSRLQKVHEVWYMSALMPGSKGHKDRVAWLANFDKDFKMPTEKQQIEFGDNATELLLNARRDKVIEGEVIDENNAKANEADAASLPRSS